MGKEAEASTVTTKRPWESQFLSLLHSGKGCEVFQWGVPKPRVKFRVKEWPRFSVQLFNHNIPFLAGTEGSGHCWDRAWLWLGRTPRSCQLSCQTCLRNLQIWCGELRTVGPTAEAAPRVSYPTFVTNTCQNWGGCYKSKAAASSVTEPPQPWGHLDATEFAGSDRQGSRGQAQEAEAAACTGSTHCPPPWNVCPQKCRFPAGGEISVLGAAQQCNTFLLEENPVPTHTGLPALLPQEGTAARRSLCSAQLGAWSSYRNRTTTPKSTAAILR